MVRNQIFLLLLLLGLSTSVTACFGGNQVGEEQEEQEGGALENEAETEGQEQEEDEEDEEGEEGED